jgi:dihydropteroate synthase
VDALKVWNAVASQAMPRAKSAPSMPKWPDEE